MAIGDDISISDWYKQSSTPIFDGANPKSARVEGSSSLVKAISIALSTPGRIGFYVDYSELSGVGTHTFYICRTHGTAGAVGVSFTSLGDSHISVTGSIAWADGEADIKKVEVVVPTKTVNGDHRIYLQLSSPTGGAVLHHGVKTIAYGVIDDGTIAGDSDAVFYDSAASGGTGTQADPYDSLYDAITNVGSKKYVYCKGTFTPDATNTINPNGGGGVAKCVYIPTGRTSEATRLSIRNWPGNTFTYDGGAATDIIGFYSDGPGGTVGDSSYVTFRGLDFSSLDCAGQTFCEGSGVGFFKNTCEQVTVELCTFDDINGSTNTAAVQPYNSESFKVWRSTANNIQVNGSSANANAGGIFLAYGAKYASVQRCEITNAHTGIYFKSPNDTHSGDTRFNDIDCAAGIQFGFGGGSQQMAHLIVQSNLIKNAAYDSAVYLNCRETALSAGNLLISNNVFDKFRFGMGGELQAIENYGNEAIIYNNIFQNCRGVWGNRNTTTTPYKYADYNHDYLTTYNRHRYNGTWYATAALLCSAEGFECNGVEDVDPVFTNAAINDYTLGIGSPCIAGGVGNVDQGIYLAGIEVIGAAL